MRYLLSLFLFSTLLGSYALADRVDLQVGDSIVIGNTQVTCGLVAPPSNKCIPNCTARYANGTCYQYGQDFCGANAQCIADCTARYANGACYQYATDVCGSYPQCTQNCTARYANGACYQYAADTCSTGN